jgi:hypothetical protein
MRNLLPIIVVAVLFSGCSAQWHLGKALQKDPQIIDVKRDSVVTVETLLKDTIYHLDTSYHLMILSDTVTITERFSLPVNMDTVTAIGADGISHARASVHNGKMKLETWAKLDTVVKLHAIIKGQTKFITKQVRIMEEREATIKKKNSLMQWVGAIIFIAFLAIVIIKR